MSENKIGRYLENPLDKFQSYSVHYILVACRTTETAEIFAAGNNDTVSLQAVTAVEKLGDEIKLPGTIGNDAYLVLDTRRFSQFTVENLKYDVMINGLQTNEAVSNLATELQMTILDSVGISFVKFMEWLLNDKMKTNFDGVVFMLRIIFVGHNADGTSETIQSETIPMILNRMDINLDYSKGAYTLEFLPNMNFNVSKARRFLTISTATTFTSGKGVKLGEAVKNFEARLNDASESYYQEIQSILGVEKNGKNKGRKVLYMITLPGDDDNKSPTGRQWANFDMIGPCIGSAAEKQFLKVGDREKAEAEAAKNNEKQEKALSTNIVAVDAGRLITDVLDKMFSQVHEIAVLGNFQNAKSDAEEVIFYKKIIGLSSDNDIIVVHVDIVEFRIANVFNSPSQNNIPQVANKDSEFYDEVREGSLIRRVPKDFIVYDYIFTGKNKDILTFDLKMENFQMLLASNLKIGDSEARKVSEKAGDLPKVDLAKVDELISLRDYDPIPLPFDSSRALQNFTNYSSLNKTTIQADRERQQSQTYASNLSKFYASCPISAVISIKGNPEILHKFNTGRSVPHSKESKSSDSNLKVNSSNLKDDWENAKVEYRRKLEKNILKTNEKTLDRGKDGSLILKSPLSEKSYAVCPVYVRINVMGPDVDFRTNSQLTDKMSNSNVLSDNFYTIFRVTNNFSGHNFTQELELFSHNIFGTYKIKPENKK